MQDVKISPVTFVVALAALLLLGLLGWFAVRPKPVAQPAVLTEEAKAYLDNLGLSEVHMQAAESYAQARLVEILGNVTNKGQRTVKLVEVVCVFRDTNGVEMQRERAYVVGGRLGSLAPGKTLPFRLPFDNLGETWNQAMPSLVIAQIQFE